MAAIEVAQTLVNLKGRRLEDGDLSVLRSALPRKMFPDWLAALLGSVPIVGACFSITEKSDISGRGGELFWLDVKGMLSETLEFEPGKSVVNHGFLAFGGCLEGSGDPYFLDLRMSSDDPPVTRVPHDYAASRPYPLEKIEIVALSLSDFLSTAVIGDVFPSILHKS
jgi:hypothetical protein